MVQHWLDSGLARQDPSISLPGRIENARERRSSAFVFIFLRRASKTSPRPEATPNRVAGSGMEDGGAPGSAASTNVFTPPALPDRVAAAPMRLLGFEKNPAASPAWNASKAERKPGIAPRPSYST